MDRLDILVKYFEENRGDFDCHLATVEKYFLTRRELITGPLPVIHSVKKRIKDLDHLREKIQRKEDEKNIKITTDNLFKQINDLAGIRILHLHNSQFALIHKAIMDSITSGRFALGEKPKAYSWDPENNLFYRNLGLVPQIKPSNYTSVHYILKANKKSSICCELQVRNLFEEIWGELDHLLNYPLPSSNQHCTEQLKVLAKLVGTGSRLATSIIRSSTTDQNIQTV